MAQEPRDLVMRNAPEYPASAAVGFTAVNSRPSRAQAAKLDMVAPPGTQSSLETSPETTALQEDLPTEHGHALGKTERVVDPTPPTDPQSRRTNSPSPYKRPTDFRIIPYTPPAEKKRKSENPGITEITKAGVQIDPQKKRKRNFSNRTKTGCQTCRRRKKKCDETKPICNNCFRGGFICEGYLTTSWPKSGIPKTTPIQSKQSFSESPRIFPRPIGEQASDNRGPIRTEESQPRLPAISEESQCDFRGQWGSPRDEQPPHRPYSQDRSVGPEYPLIMARAPSDPYRRPSDVEPGQQDQPLTPLARGTRYNQEQPLPPPQTIFEIMKKGRPYSRSDPVLVEFRKRCKALLRKYNFALMAGICEDGDMRLLRDVIMPPLDGPGEESFKTGRLAEDARIEGPFTCDYGWNVTLGEKVAIGPNCNFEDGAEIFIGPRTVIGPDVKIYTSDPWKWPFREDGNEVKTISRRIVIEEDVFIGGNSTILSGIRIKKGTIVAAGSVLNRRMFGPDGVIPERSFVTGNPARVLRDVP
ncbi:trimeric LpxA-like protein [Phyllosticta citricarpa]